MVKEGWEEIKLGKVAEVFSGYAFKSSDLNEGDISVIKIGNIQNKRVLKKCTAFFSEDKLSKKLTKYFLDKDDFLIAMTGAGSVGKTGKMRSQEKEYLINQRVGIVRVNKEKADPELIFQIISQDRFEDLMYKIGLGAGQPNISAENIKSLEFILPKDLEHQQKIASILLNYDNLIENNEKRIKILEKIAKLIYEEWFVKFKFPGHEDAKMVDSGIDFGEIPEGWEVKKMGDLISLEYGKALIAKNRNLGNYPVYGSSGIVGYHDKYLVEAPGIVVGRAGNAGEIHWANENFWPVDSSFYVKITDLEVNLPYVYYSLEKSNLKNLISGSAVPGINRNAVYLLDLIKPDIALLKRFNLEITKIFLLIHKLRLKNQNLRKTRDLLLPKLISGEIDVSNLDIKIPEVEA